MWNNNYFLFIRLFPLAFQIVLPLMILCCWAVVKVPHLLFGKTGPPIKIDSVFAN